ncbi:hypothetical protein [Agrobacterium tumefaciens]|uniref:hypothetical protein n=1 Tax=Agrobacterium tumefaciens TaxID=358 RepID=UPI00147962BB|nr:hypothetical protein [Agrobacterium tumefaciens]
MRIKTPKIINILMFWTLISTPALAQQQMGSQAAMNACANIATLLQMGGPQLQSAFGQHALFAIFQQTGGTGRYLPLVQLGPVHNVMIGGENVLPLGSFLTCRTVHQNGYADWQLAFSQMTQRFENFQFNSVPGGNPNPNPTPNPTPNPNPNPNPNPTPNPVPKPPSDNQACQKFPELCP